ncbi:MAG: nucleotide exchange factor GrpE [Gammaproteobacteria bacterium]|nr:nucleotide exchange factor GrpE [Gammaproteobacteria bacterium]
MSQQHTEGRSVPESGADEAATVVDASLDERSGCNEAESTEASAEQPEATVESLQMALDAARGEAAASLDKALRASAELDNYRKRADREIENARRFALERFLQELLPVKDSLEMGLAAAAAEGVDVNSLREGSELTLKMLNGVVEKQGVVEVDPMGQAFDPDLHQAISMQDADSGTESGTVISVIQKGYTLHERLIRPALVVVAR